MSQEPRRPSIFERLAKRGSIDKSSTNSDLEKEPPPPYEAVVAEAENVTADADEPVNLTAAFDNLTLSNLPVDPTVETCLAHLKLMFAFQWMKEDVGFTDGLWGLWDSRAGPADPILKGRPEKGKGKQESAEAEPSVEERMRNKNLETLSRVREKRWALFVARAVDRYETWWKSLMKSQPGRPLSESDMDNPDSVEYSGFPTDVASVLHWTEDMLPPLDVLMVWHTHMLNPRAFLEDAMLAGLRHFWITGLPWDLVNKAIDSDFNYDVSAACKRRWRKNTGLTWDNVDGPPDKAMKCPRCATMVNIPWTTCHFPEVCDGEPPGLEGEGYGDSNLQYTCPRCGMVISRDLLPVVKFFNDHRALIFRQRPMPGTLLDPKTGTPIKPPTNKKNVRPSHTFPNRLLKSECNNMRTEIIGLATRRTVLPRTVTMHNVRKGIEGVLADKRHVKLIDRYHPSVVYKLPPESRIAVRKMMSRYWDNSSLFALDLSGAVMRQGVFVEKMCQLDWLHSPSARDTMARLLTKYSRFMKIIGETFYRFVAVPTLDVDLAWHTHQLSPSRYYGHTLSTAARFVNHDDKIDEGTLSKQFEWTSRVYQIKYGEVYSECTCWYCEAIRSRHISSVGQALGLSTQEKIAEAFHTSGAANLYPAQKSAHISSHPSVQFQRDTDAANTNRPTAYHSQIQIALMTSLTELHTNRLDAAYKRAAARAAKKGRPVPARDAVYYDHWGYPYAYAAPYAYPLWWTAGLYAGAGQASPGWAVACGTGGCVAGTCGGAVARGGCGSAGGCGGIGAGGAGIAGCGGNGGGPWGGGAGGGCGG